MRPVFAIAALLLACAACQGPPAGPPRASPASAALGVRTLSEDLVLWAGSEGTLTPASRRTLHAFLDDRTPYALRVTVAGRSPAGQQAVASAIAQLRRAGVPAEQIARGRFRPDAGSGDVVLRTRRAAATLPDCPDWSRPSVLGRRPGPSSNFGCADAVNLGRMVADPAELEHGRSLAPAPAVPAVRALETLQAGSGEDGGGSGGGAGEAGDALSISVGGSGGGL